MSSRARTRVGFALATWFGCGLVPYAPGTAGTIGGLPLYWALRPLGPLGLALGSIAVAAVGIWAASVVAQRTRLHDPQIVVIDEVAGFLLTLSAAPAGWKGVLAAFVLFRLFDTLKPWPANAAESLPSGWGIVLDDLAAGLWGAGALLMLRATGVL